MPQPDGFSLRDHIASAKRQGLCAAEMANMGLPHEPPAPPPELHRVLPVFYRLCGTRTYLDGGVPAPLRDSEILAWSQLRGEPLNQVELMMLDVLDQTWLWVMRTKGAPDNG